METNKNVLHMLTYITFKKKNLNKVMLGLFSFQHSTLVSFNNYLKMTNHAAAVLLNENLHICD